jgi:hypothetical protein
MPLEFSLMGLLSVYSNLFNDSAVIAAGGVWGQLIGTEMSVIWLVYSAFWLWMVIHCVRTEPDRFFWLWIMTVVVGVGPLLYLFLRYLPASDIKPPGFLRRWTRGTELTRLETAALQIGNPHQFIQWGDALREVGRYDEAAAAYERALQKDSANLPALWGAALVAAMRKQPERTRDLTRRILDKDPQYKFGDVSLYLGKSLVELADHDTAVIHFEQHVKRWRHPEGVFLYSKLLAERGESEMARRHLESLLLDINGSPASIARKHGRWKSRAKQLLKRLPAR